MKADELILLALLANKKSIKGKTYLQKSLYFIGTRLKADLKFIPHYYGPYSPEVNNALASLIDIGMISENEEEFKIYNSQGFEIKRYDYKLTSAGEKISKGAAKKYNEDWKKIQKFFSELNESGTIDYVDLSIAAKAHYLIDKEGKPVTPEEIREKAKSFAWKIDEKSLERAIKILEKLGFVTTIDK